MISYVFGPRAVACFDCIEIRGTAYCTMNCGAAEPPCPTCGGRVAPGYVHDHRPDLTGLDDGPPLHPKRKKPAPKSAAETRDIRARAWATRRSKYGEHGHR